MQSVKPLKILQASAGSGKTYSLTAHYLTLLFDGETKYREILAVTFTNKATAEMKSRILEVLKSLALGHADAEGFRDIILQSHPNLNAETLQEKAHLIYRNIIHDYSRFAVNTIDGFVQKVIRSFSFELGLDAGFRLEMNIDKVKQELAQKLNEQLDKKPELLQWIIDLALDRIRNDKSWNYHDTLLDLAGEIFKERYQPFENALKALNPDEVFKDLQELNKAIIEHFEGGIADLGKNANDIFQKSGVLIDELKGKSRSPLSCLTKIVDGDYDKIKSLGKLIDDPEEWQKGKLSASVSTLYDQLNPILKALSRFQIEELPRYGMAKAIDANLYYLRLMQEMAGLLKEYRQENGTLLISDAQNLLKGITADLNDNTSFIWEKTGNRFKHFLFDEFQDTSSYQWDNFLPLVQNAIAEANGKLIDHLIVGDVKQSIYRWRNGDWRILLHQAKANIGDLQVLEDSLSENYRSTANIIDFNNFLFKQSPQILQNHINEKVIADGGEDFFNTWWKESKYDDIIIRAYEQSHQLKAKSTLIGGSIEIGFIPSTDNRTRVSQSKEEIFDRLAITLNEWISSGRYQAGQICILVRKNGEARDVIEHLMRDQQVRQAQSATNFDQKNSWKPFEVLSGEALLIANNSGVKLLINTLYAMVSKTNDNTLYKSICVQLYTSQLNKPVAADTWMKLKSSSIPQLKGILPDSLCDNWLPWQTLPLTELIEQLIGAYRLNISSIHLPYLIAFRDMISQFAGHGDRGITRFLEWWDEEGQRKALPSGEQSNAVQVMTVHKSKGLAFDVVMMPFCSWNLDGMANSIFWVDTAETSYAMMNSLPVHYKKSLGQSAFAKAYFEELLFNYMDALNMLYVAVTRTRKHLYITAPGQADGKDDQLGIAGDVIYQALQSINGEFKVEFEENKFILDEPVPEKEKSSIKKDAESRFKEDVWSFSNYPLSSRINDALTDRKVNEQVDLFSTDKSQQRGIILHEILAKVNEISDLELEIKQMQQNGWFKESEYDEILKLATSVLSQPELNNILKKDYTTFNEQTIITKEGESYRPDKVLIGEDEVIIIDFKFTGQPKKSHYEQVERYKGLLSEIGYQNIKAYLYYGYLKELKVV